MTILTKRIVASDDDDDSSSIEVEKPVKHIPKKKKGEKSNIEDLGLVPGMCLVGRLEVPKLARHAWIRVSKNCSLKLQSTDIEVVDNWKSNWNKSLKNDQFVKCIYVKSAENRLGEPEYFATIRPDLIALANPKTNMLPKDIVKKEQEEAERLPVVSSLVKGFVEHVDKSGVYVRISRCVLALVPLKFLADRYVEDASKEFPIGTLVVGRVQSCDEAKRSVVLSLQASQVLGTEMYTWSTLKPGTKVNGTISRIEDYGVFVSLQNSVKLSGLCHVKEMADEPVKNPSKLYSKGDEVRVFVIDVNPEKRRIQLSMKKSHFDEDEDEDIAQEGHEDESSEESQEENASEAETSDEDDDEDDEENVLEAMEDSDDDSDVEALIKKAQLHDEDSEEENEEDDDSEDEDDEDDDSKDEDDDKPKKSNQPMSLLDALSKANMTSSRDASDSENESSDEEDTDEDDKVKNARKKSSKSKQREKRREEAEITAKEQAMLNGVTNPQDADEFERLLIASPNSSMLWIQYIAFQIAQTEMDQARVIARRALRTINFREETERQNVWFALLQVEHRYGSQESVEAVMKEMTCQMNPKHAYYKLAEIYRESGKIDEADAALKKASKMSKGQSRGAWLRRLELKLVDGKDAKGARELLQAALRSIESRKHAPLVLDFARLEYSSASGDAERARTLCEGLIESYPKRNDIWHQYIDCEIKYGNDPKRVRNLFERVLTMKFTVKKIKAFFKKWLVYESEHGTSNDVEEVKSRARAYVEALTSQ